MRSRRMQSEWAFWVYNSQVNSNWLRIEVNDSKNNKYRLGDLDKLDWKGWRYVEIPTFREFQRQHG